MAKTTAQSAEQPAQQEGEDPNRVVDPPPASAADTEDAQQAPEQQWVMVDQSAILTLPSGASYNLQAGNIMQLSSEDAAYVIDNGYASETEAPSYEPETGFPAETEVQTEPGPETQTEPASEG